MAERFLRLLPVFMLALLAALTYWLDKTVQTSPIQSGEKRLSHNPDFTADKLLVTRMDVNGRIRDTLQAAKLIHFPDDDSTELDQPRFVSLARTAPLTIASNQALVSSNGGNIYFRGDVRAKRAAPAGADALTLTTEYLHFIPDDNIAKTDRPVTIRNATMMAEAVGMELNTETRVLKLLSAVRGVYQDPQANETTNRAGKR